MSLLSLIEDKLLLMAPKPLPIAKRLADHSVANGDCRLWDGYCSNNGGYGIIRIGNESKLVHRVAWREKYGQWPIGKLYNTCNQILCINPEHWIEKPSTGDYTPEQGRKAHLKRKFGITPSYYDALLKKQNGACAACKQLPGDSNLCVDHCHSTGEIRALLCRRCNTVIGFLNEDARVSSSITRYIRKFC